jgi:predicted nucleic acid-binding protein
LIIHLDTSFLIRALVRGSVEDDKIRTWLTESMPFAISSVVWAEFLCGPLTTAQLQIVQLVAGEPEPFSAQNAATAARLYNDTGRRRGSLLDCMVAAAALDADAQLATCNARDFQRFAEFGLVLVK